MRVNGKSIPTTCLEPDAAAVGIIAQTKLPHELVIVPLPTPADAAHAIRAMLVRGAPLIGAAAAYGVALAMREDASDLALEKACRALLATRPTAVNLRWALEEMRALLTPLAEPSRAVAAYTRAGEI